MRGRSCWGPEREGGHGGQGWGGWGICFPHSLHAWEGLFCPSSPHLPLHTFLSSPHTLLLSRDFYFLTSPPFFFHERTLNFWSPSREAYLLPPGNSSLERTSSPFLTSLSPLQRSSPSISLAPFQDAHLPAWSLLSSQELSLPPLPCRDTPSGSPLPSWGSHLQPLLCLRCSPLTLPFQKPGSLRLLPWRLHLSD